MIQQLKPDSWMLIFWVYLTASTNTQGWAEQRDKSPSDGGNGIDFGGYGHPLDTASFIIQ